MLRHLRRPLLLQCRIAHTNLRPTVHANTTICIASRRDARRSVDRFSAWPPLHASIFLGLSRRLRLVSIRRSKQLPLTSIRPYLEADPTLNDIRPLIAQPYRSPSQDRIDVRDGDVEIEMGLGENHHEIHCDCSHSIAVSPCRGCLRLSAWNGILDRCQDCPSNLFDCRVALARRDRIES